MIEHIEKIEKSVSVGTVAFGENNEKENLLKKGKSVAVGTIAFEETN